MITDPPDVIVGDLEQGGGCNNFVFPDAIDLDLIVSDDNTGAAAIIWSYSLTDTQYTINGSPKLSSGDPNAPNAGEDIRQNDTDTADAPNDGTANTITVRNEALSAVAAGPCYGDPPSTGILASETRAVSLFASDGTLFDTSTIMVYTANDSSDSLSGGGATLTPIYNLDFENTPADTTGWLGAVLVTPGSTAIATGLCMGANLGNNNGVIGWVSPPNFAPGPGWVPLVRENTYRMSATLYTDQTAANAIPFLDWGYNNFQLNVGDGNNYGGIQWLLDVAGGATGIGRFQDVFNYWAGPNSALLPQWNGDVDPSNSAFDPGVAFKTGWNLTFRILHNNAGIVTSADAGTICLRQLQVGRVDITTLGSTTLFNAPISSKDLGGVYFRDPEDFGTPANGQFQIDEANNWANVQLTANPTAAGAAGAGARRKLIYQDTTLANFNLQLFPLQWLAGRLYMGEYTAQSNVPGPGEGTDPLDAVFCDWDTPTAELGAFNFTQKGASGNLLRAPSPRLPATVSNAAQTYVSFIEGTEPSQAGLIGPAFADSDRIRGYFDMFNSGPSPLLGTSTDGLDALRVTDVRLSNVDTSGF